MQPGFNEILFMLSTLFGLNNEFIARETKLFLDLESKTGSIEYLDIRIHEEDTAYIENGLEQIDRTANFIKHATLKLESKKIEKEDSNIQVLFTFSFNDLKEALALFNFKTTSGASAFYYNPYPDVEIGSTNGEIKSDRYDNKIISWAETDQIKLELSLKDNHWRLRQTKPIIEYLKK